MVRTVLADASCQQYADERMLKRAPAEVGILVGRRTSTKDLILQFVSTPEEEEGHGAVRVVAGRSGKQGTSSSLEFDTEWISEHACQLARILPGGLCVLGLYVFCESEAFQGSQSALAGVLKRICSTMVFGKKDAATLAVHVDSGRGVLSAKEKDGTAFKPCEMKNSSLLTEMVEIRCLYPLNVRVDICSDKILLCDLISDMISYEVEQRVSKAVPLFHGQTPKSQEDMIHDMRKEGCDHIPIEFLIPLSRYGVPAVGVKKVHKGELSGTYYSKGQFTLTGNMECRAYVYNREKVEDTIDAIKEDIDSSLRSRLEVLVEAAEMATEAMQQQSDERVVKNGKAPGIRRNHPLLDSINHVGSYVPRFPQRAFLNWKVGACTYCDYIVQGDGVTEALHRIRELVGPGRVDATTFHCSENVIGHGNTSKKEASKKRGVLETLFSSCNIMLTGAAVIVAFMAILISLLLL